MSYPVAGPDKVSVLIDTLSTSNPKQWSWSNLIFKNGKGVISIKELGMLKAEMKSFAKDPTKGIEQLGNAPKKPDTTKMTKEEADIAEEEFMIMMGQYNMAKLALQEHVEPGDMIIIENYLEPYYDSLSATPAIKGKRWHALTKQIEDEQRNFLSGFGKGSQQV